MGNRDRAAPLKAPLTHFYRDYAEVILIHFFMFTGLKILA